MNDVRGGLGAGELLDEDLAVGEDVSAGGGSFPMNALHLHPGASHG